MFAPIMKTKSFLRLLAFVALLNSHCLCVNGQLAANLKQHISFLASDSLHGRMTGSVDERNAANYIIAEFKKTGATNQNRNFNPNKYLQHFVYHPKTDSIKTTVSGNNVVAFIDNGAANTIVLGAHYDHLGWGLPVHSA